LWNEGECYGDFSQILP